MGLVEREAVLAVHSPDTQPLDKKQATSSNSDAKLQRSRKAQETALQNDVL
jgi:hypothetical protein